jgi:transposase
VQAAKHAYRRPGISEELRRRQEGQDPRVVEVAWRAQRRLHRQWHRLATRRGKHANVATVACARELAAFVWEAALIA